MANRHIKVINGRKYYYSSIRKGKKITSKYLGPVERIRQRKASKEPAAEEEIYETKEDESDYIG